MLDVCAKISFMIHLIELFLKMIELETKTCIVQNTLSSIYVFIKSEYEYLRNFTRWNYYIASVITCIVVFCIMYYGSVGYIRKMDF